jgi:tryptophan synthase alpha chain
MGFDFFYLMSDFKITGSTFSLHPRLQRVIERIKQHSPDIRIGIGFGISTPEQARSVADAADVAIIGSALIQAQQSGQLEAYLKTLAAA